MDRALSSMAANSAGIRSAVVDLRVSVQIAYAVGCRPDRIDRALGMSVDQGALRRLVGAGGFRGSGIACSATRDEAIANVEAASMDVRRMVVAHAAYTLDRMILDWVTIGDECRRQAAAACRSIVDLLKPRQMAKLPLDIMVTAPDGLEAAWLELDDASRRLPTPDRVAMARALAVIGASQSQIAAVMGSATGRYGNRSQLSAWRRFGSPATHPSCSEIVDRASHALAALAATRARFVSLLGIDNMAVRPVDERSVPPGTLRL